MKKIMGQLGDNLNPGEKIETDLATLALINK